MRAEQFAYLVIAFCKRKEEMLRGNILVLQRSGELFCLSAEFC